jgi:hypothetical protein
MVILYLNNHSLGRKQEFISKIIRVKREGGVFQAGENLSSKHEALNSNLSTVRKKKKKKKEKIKVPCLGFLFFFFAVLGFELGFHSWVGQVPYHLSNSARPLPLSSYLDFEILHSMKTQLQFYTPLSKGHDLPY